MFVSGATVDWNGQPLKIMFVSQPELTAVVPASDAASPTTASITVTNPGTPVASNAVFFQVMTPEPNVYYEDARGYSPGVEVGGELADMQSLATGNFADNGMQGLAAGVANSGGSRSFLQVRRPT
jgi:uncharacterized protein (TIGR03437 family)